MPSGKEIFDGIKFLKDGGPAAVLGLIVGYILAMPRGCGNAFSGQTQCHNLLGQHIPAFDGSPVSYKWIGSIIGFIIAFAIGGWLIGSGIRFVKADMGSG